jgi:3-keto-disaccharide hydrolase/FG-GAP-like repeat
MISSSNTFGRFFPPVVAAAAMVVALHAAEPKNFKPDATFSGSTLTGWHVLGDADWKAQNGELIGTAKPGTAGGWLVMDKSFQDVRVFANYRCTGECKSGVLLRAQRTPDGGMRGVYVSLTDGEAGSYSVTLDARGRESGRERLAAPQRGGGGSGRGAAPAAAPSTPPAAPPATAPAAAPGTASAAAGAGAGQGRAGGAGGGGGRGVAVLKPGEWNELEIILALSSIRSTFGGNSAIDESNLAGYGPIALFVGGSGEVRYKNVAWKDLNSFVQPKEEVSPRFTMQQISSLYYGWGVSTGDINHDGTLDIVSGPFYYLGPAFTERKLYREGRVYNPATEFAPDMVNLVADFNGDGWPDILSAVSRPMDLYVNPKEESRRWQKFAVLPTVTSEIALMKDLDNDGKPEIVFAGGGAYNWANPDPANPTAAWTPHVVSSQGQTVLGHGIGVGDINGDGRKDIVVPTGWYEQPAQGVTQSPWTFHAVTFGNLSVFGQGGGEIGVYDVNGDKLTDVVTGSAHNWGLNWFEQKRGGDGTITFEQHMIAQDFSTTNAGGVVFSESHAARFEDMDGDKIPDFVTGKRMWSELENYTAQDPYGPPVLYIYRTVRDGKAPGGARFVPELVHNRSGVGSSFDVADLNRDGRPDIVTATAFGTFVFFGKK